MKEKRDASVEAGFSKRALVDHIQLLRRYARALVRNPADADDLVQETLRRVLTYLDNQSDIRNLRSYLLTVLHNARADMLKRRQRQGEEVMAEDVDLVASGATPVETMACREVMTAINRLSEEHRQIILLIALEGLSYRETAEILDLKIGTVMSRLNRARAALREDLGLRDREPVFEAG